MCSRPIGALVCLALLAGPPVRSALSAGPPKRKPLAPQERTAILGLIKVVDLAQETDPTPGGNLEWNSHILKSGNQTAYVPFRLRLLEPAAGLKSAIMYVRAVSRHDGMRAKDERSIVRDWMLKGDTVAPRVAETVFVGPGEMPVGGPAAGSSRQSIAAPAEASAVLALHQRELERQKAAAGNASPKAETKERNPFVFPFEDYYVLDMKSTRGADARSIERALSLPAGEYDVYVALIDRERLKTSSATIVKHRLIIPNYWNDELALSSLILASDVRTLPMALAPLQQGEHPYTFGRAEVLPVPSATFTPGDVLSVVYQICNYGAPDWPRGVAALERITVKTIARRFLIRCLAWLKPSAFVRPFAELWRDRRSIS